ncbi:MAG: NAD-dependent epimerase/dehydratase family protein [Burkholderiales bacterium]
MTRVLVTGAAGFVGRQVLALLADTGYTVHAVSSRTSSPALPASQWHRADLRDPLQAAAVIKASLPTHLLHLAWCTNPDDYRTSPENECWRAGSTALLETFGQCGGQRAVVAGTCMEYDWQDGLCHEDVTPLRPDTAYGRAKTALGAQLDVIASASGFSAAWGRLFFLYGPYEKSRRFVPAVIESLLAGVPALCTHGRQVRDYLHVADAARAFVTLLECRHPGAVNIASGTGVSLGEIGALLAQAVGRPDLLRLGAIPAPAAEAPRVVGEVSRLESLGWKPRYTLTEGLRDTVEWWRRTARAPAA